MPIKTRFAILLALLIPAFHAGAQDVVVVVPACTTPSQTGATTSTAAPTPQPAPAQPAVSAPLAPRLQLGYGYPRRPDSRSLQEQILELERQRPSLVFPIALMASGVAAGVFSMIATIDTCPLSCIDDPYTLRFAALGTAGLTAAVIGIVTLVRRIHSRRPINRRIRELERSLLAW